MQIFLADCITWGIDINIDADSKVKTIKIRNSSDGKMIKFTFRRTTGMGGALDKTGTAFFIEHYSAAKPPPFKQKFVTLHQTTNNQ